MDNFIEFDYRGKHYIYPINPRDLELLDKCKAGDRLSFVDLYGFGKIFSFEDMENIATSEV